ncbi:DUF3300 domain-containing protein [Xanthomonas vesicatoria]|uniref:DUF3300 domain-containing protein n=1 Tax=Xanthomonas vesicatoria TaxID=56460 RepID=UPI001E4F72AC|nr:DUF3300 domain-containing protein [Xanthomonas vesicatoria]MCC8619259.1 DUF3300 domain-containing protein [Xanthomonas vesicatoria]MCC8632907.1 DUF3300 domain-containing protein [Xanthomonas vesicatoria]
MQRTWSQGRLGWALAIASGGVLALVGCQPTAPQATAMPPVESPASIAPAYTPPTADQLYRLVAPIALFPDKLLAQTLAASVYPDQLLTAQDWLHGNRNLTATDRAQATVSQPWDPSIKALTAFPDVVDQLAGNLDWTRALGDAYAHDPNDVLNAVQIMRQRAQTSGHLRSTPQQQVQVARHVVVTPVLDGERVPPPSQIITIEPAHPEVVYVPRYDPGVVYGTPVDVYRDYRYRPVRWYDQGDVVTTGVVSFGVGVLVGSALEHHRGWFGWAAPAPAWHHWGWNSWNVDWNAPPAAPHYVMYQNHVYAPRTTIINNNRSTYIDARSYVRQDQRDRRDGTAASASVPGLVPKGPTVNPAALPIAPAAGAQLLNNLQRPNGIAPSPANAARRPDYAHLSAPHFDRQMLQPGRPVPTRVAAPMSANLGSQAQATLRAPTISAPMLAPHARPAMRTSAPPVAQQRIAHVQQLHQADAAARGPALNATPQARPAPTAQDAFASRDPYDGTRHVPAATQFQPLQIHDQQRAAARQQAALAPPQRMERAQPLPPRQEPRPITQTQPAQHPQRMVSFAAPRPAPAHPTDMHAQRPPTHAQAPQHRDHHRDS